MSAVADTTVAGLTSGTAAADRYVLLGVPDVHGTIRGKALRPTAFATARRSGTKITDLLLALDPVDVPITTYRTIGIRSGAGDLRLDPDPETVRPLSWRPGWQICLGSLSWPDGRPCELASREVLRGSLAAMADLGYDVRAAFEYEVRLTDGNRGPLSSGISYSAGEITRLEHFAARLEGALELLGVTLTAIHTEAGPGLIELNIAPGTGLRAADDALMLKFAVKEVAASMGLRASFMAKPVAGEEGSSGHIHVSLWSVDRNVLGQRAGSGGLNAIAAGAVAGILAHLPAASLALNPTINSYKRLIPGWFAPVSASWGLENRSAALRVIMPTDQPDGARIECRRGGADANPYLALAVLVHGAADGLRRGLTPPAAVSGDATATPAAAGLPESLASALTAWRDDAMLRTAVGPAFSDYFATSRQWELAAWQQTVTEWERDRYERAA